MAAACHSLKLMATEVAMAAPRCILKLKATEVATAVPLPTLRMATLANQTTRATDYHRMDNHTLLLAVRWHLFRATCIVRDTCLSHPSPDRTVVVEAMEEVSRVRVAVVERTQVVVDAAGAVPITAMARAMVVEVTAASKRRGFLAFGLEFEVWIIVIPMDWYE
jgi:hypothetical protein